MTTPNHKSKSSVRCFELTLALAISGALPLLIACALPLLIACALPPLIAPAIAQTSPAHNFVAWKQHVPAEARARTSPIPASADNIAAGAKLYSDSCARCHGRDANGIRNKPSLRGPDTTSASDGELFWLLRNGDLYHGMPSWSAMPETQRWQIIAYIRSLNPSATPAH